MKMILNFCRTPAAELIRIRKPSRYHIVTIIETKPSDTNQQRKARLSESETPIPNNNGCKGTILSLFSTPLPSKTIAPMTMHATAAVNAISMIIERRNGGFRTEDVGYLLSLIELVRG